MAKATYEKVDVYQVITDQLIAAIEAGAGKWEMPWTKTGMETPTNVVSKKPYRGINTLMLWLTADIKGYSHGIWATYKQWADLGANVRKGEKSTTIVFWKSFTSTDEDGDEKTGMFAKAYAVFNVAQVDGYEIPAPVLHENNIIEHAEEYFKNIRAIVRTGGDRAFYSPSGDYIGMPYLAQFKDSISYYSTLAHEHVHWSGHKTRCNRDLEGRFGNEAYAFEELIADIGSAFLCAKLGLANEARQDHAAYIAGWLKVLKKDKKAIFSAASMAQKAADFLDSLQPSQELEKAA